MRRDKKSDNGHEARRAVRELAGRAFSRAAGAPLVDGNRIRLLNDARENYPAWLDAINAAKHYINFENYIYYEDAVGLKFADALIARSNATHAITFECVKWRLGPRTSQMPSSGSRHSRSSCVIIAS